ncbi:hypothetical protein ACFQMM_22770 [Saliphagus sp. GCM10025308]
MGGGPTFDPDAKETMSEAEANQYLGISGSRNSHREKSNKGEKAEERKRKRKEPSSNQETPKESKRMKYAKRYGDSWPLDRKKRFLREHDVSASEMGWKLRE